MGPLQTFLTCVLQPRPSEGRITRSDDGWKTSGFFQDSSLRSTFCLPLQIECPSQATLDELLATRCLDSFIKKEGHVENISSDLTSLAENVDAAVEVKSAFNLAIEARVVLTLGTGEAISAAVENIIIKSGAVEGTILCIDTELTLRVRSEAGRIDPSSVVKISIDVGAVLTEDLPVQTQSDAALTSLKALNLGGLPEISLESQHQRRPRARLPSFELTVSLSFAMRIAAHSIPSHVMGQTYISLTISHSNMHKEILTVTNIALHPGHSVLRSGDSGLRQQVTDMSRSVKWSYLPDCAPSLPLTLTEHESYSSCLIVYATGDKTTRKFSSPISVTALVGSPDRPLSLRSIVAACDVQWTTCRAAVEPADAFRVDLRVLETDAITVGKMLTVELDILNLSSEPRQPMILVNNSKEVSVVADKKETAKTAVISNKGDHKFGVWGLLNNDCPGDSFIDKDRELLSVDIALVANNMDPGSSTKAFLRFVPLVEGLLHVPNFQIIDRRKGQWYSALHNLELVARPVENC